MNTQRTSRPARPARWMAEDCVISLVNNVSNPGSQCKYYTKNEPNTHDVPPALPRAKNRFSLNFPVSMTYLTPGMVIDVSATLVANMHLRVLGGGGINIFACCPGGRAA